ncbi:hypothetical protein CpipJ_CPIJ013630 [Culex quinquefasciatus]|uniref:Uncharacterized protein n=1 Tax=Culex quinquefasciatus TaxID=7176 RepID=B0X3R9_CULQU|nr:hypothetical protein CpipJ_CPIJ013630 [Culex quinquefasciatus]|eukprot:XP_001864292.1 hypothetical protein CpipJ_CPIJ013630 [Culex quinquefasciatus]
MGSSSTTGRLALILWAPVKGSVLKKAFLHPHKKSIVILPIYHGYQARFPARAAVVAGTTGAARFQAAAGLAPQRFHGSAAPAAAPQRFQRGSTAAAAAGLFQRFHGLTAPAAATGATLGSAQAAFHMVSEVSRPAVGFSAGAQAARVTRAVMRTSLNILKLKISGASLK